MPDNEELELKRRELNLSEARLQQERQLKELELTQAKQLKDKELALNHELKEKELDQSRQLKEKELEIQRKQLSASRWTGPAAVAVVAGVLALIGSLITVRQNLELERKKQEGSLLLEALRTDLTGKAREQQIAANLVFFADAAGLINIDPDRLKKLRQEAGSTTPALSSATGSTTNTIIPSATRQQILKSFDSFGKYFETLGLKASPRIDVQVSTEPGAIAYYDPSRQAVFVESGSLGDRDLTLREFAHAVLYSSENKSKVVDYERTWVYVGIESGLASYFSSSYRDDAHIPSGSVNDLGSQDQTLENQRKLNDLKAGPTAMWDGTLAWGAAFWDLRRTLGKSVSDKLLYKSWEDLTESEITKNNPHDFVRRVLVTDGVLNKGQYAGQIQEVFSRHGLILPPH
jgi:hypothetical protein